MRLASITVEKYRSIIKAYKIALDATTVLVGPNNEGKSNILFALNAAMKVLTRESLILPGKLDSKSGFVIRTRLYDWNRDFPIGLQDAQPEGSSIIALDFDLTDEERRAFSSEVNSQVTGKLSLKIEFKRDQKAKITINKRGQGARL